MASAITSTPLAARYRYHVLLRVLACLLSLCHPLESSYWSGTQADIGHPDMAHLPARDRCPSSDIGCSQSHFAHWTWQPRQQHDLSAACLQMNMADSERMAGVLESVGYQCADDASDADVLIYNTCSIRDKAEQKVYSALGRQVGNQTQTDRAVCSCECMHSSSSLCVLHQGQCGAKEAGGTSLMLCALVNIVWGFSA